MKNHKPTATTSTTSTTTSTSTMTSETPSSSLTKTTSNTTASNGFDDTSEFVTAASSLAAGDSIQDWLGSGANSIAASKRQDRPKWTLHTESEVHVQRLEAKLASLKKTKQTTSRKKSPAQAEHLDFNPDDHDLESQEILAGQEESDEGLWLLWNSQPSLSEAAPAPAPAPASKPAPSPPSPPSPSASAGSEGRTIPAIQPPTTTIATAQPPTQYYGSMNMKSTEVQQDHGKDHNSGGDSDDSDGERAEREERLDQARHKAKHIDQYTRDTRCCAVCSTECVIS
ncbi:hypothetical protein DFQ27_004790 [Actinomortierella ambigua]|uniref:Uncharacterized protein n=1 Tax=Actinomortierella ambigua TaxID=1343610 RepID=A0A9P6Q0R2_9FUNG|nr:hypothetical protein DFQ27_004790 [Actinomortierella ambigua]